MAFLDDNPVLEKGTSLRIGSWIFIADGSGGFESCSTDQDPPEVSKAAKQCEFDKFIDQFEEFGVLDLINEARIQPEFDAIKAKTLSELEEDLKKTAGRSQAGNLHERKDHTFQFHPCRRTKFSEEKVKD